MSLPSEADVFETGLRSYKPSRALDSLIRQHLEAARLDIKMSSASPPTPPPGPMSSTESTALLNELGDYFTRTAKMWSSVAEHVLQGPHIESAMLDIHEQSRKQSFMTNFSEISNIDVEIDRLRRIRDLTARYSREVQAVWKPNPPPSRSRDSISISNLVDMDQPPQSALIADSRQLQMHAEESQSIHSSQMQIDSPHSQQSDDDSDSEDDEELFLSIDMDALKQRGKGTYYCPKGMRCEKGGVENGALVLFDRNSAFAQHCNKHRKPWRCDVPGCPNPPKKRKFARRDGLERHKATVKHFVVT